MWKDIATAGNAAKSFENLLQLDEARRGRYERHWQELRNFQAIWRETLERLDKEEGVVMTQMHEIIRGLIELRVLRLPPGRDINLPYWRKGHFFPRIE